MEKSPDKIQLRRSWIFTGKIIQKTKDNLRVLRQFWGARATKQRHDISALHSPTSEFRFKLLAGRGMSGGIAN
jgi:hypothetical protein